MTDENLPAARTQLADALHDLCSTQTTIGPKGVLTAPCLYIQLQTAVSDRSARPQNGGQGGRQGEPVWIDGLVLLDEIDRTTAVWAGERGHTMSLLRNLEIKKWRPQDAPLLGTYTLTIHGWVKRAKQLLDCGFIKELLFPCPWCKKEYIYRHVDGENIRSRSLTLTSDGARCGHCKHHWPPNLLTNLIAQIKAEQHAH